MGRREEVGGSGSRGRSKRGKEHDGKESIDGLKTRTPDVDNNSIKPTIVLLRMLASVSFLWIYTSECLIYPRSYRAVENKSLKATALEPRSQKRPPVSAPCECSL